MGDFKQLTEQLKQILIEMTLRDQPCYGNIDSIEKAITELKKLKSGCFIVPDTIKIEKIVDKNDINWGITDPVYEGIKQILKYPIKISWGEKDIFKQGKGKGGHGIKHAMDGHGEKFSTAIEKLPNILLRNTAKIDKRTYDNYVIETNRFKYVFGLKNGYAILITALEK